MNNHKDATDWPDLKLPKGETSEDITFFGLLSIS